LERTQLWPNCWGIPGRKIIDGKGDRPEVEIFCGDINLIFEDADLVVLRNFDSKGPVGDVAENKAKKLSGIKSYDSLDLF